jgi:phosphatidylglycerol---prolipoprotein diacylglyceryl transferase
VEYWQHLYEHLDPVALDLGFVTLHWYGIMYVLALLAALWFAKWIVRADRMPIHDETLDYFFIYIEIGVILGARLGYILFYDPDTLYYLTHPWQIFNPFVHGEFVGIRGMSYHGAILGALIAMWLFEQRHRGQIYPLLDLVALSVPVGYLFGRIGNFLNQELIGRPTDLPWGIFVEGTLKHPSQLYEAVLEGVLVAATLYLWRRRKRFEGELFIWYGVLYSIARFIAEFWRAPDPQLGFICCDWMTMGQAMSLVMLMLSLLLIPVLGKRARAYRPPAT